MGALLDVAVSFFADDGWPYTINAEQTTLRTQYGGRNGSFLCIGLAREAERQFVFWSYCPMTIPSERRLAMAEFLTRANYGLYLGNYELNLEDGQVRFKTSLDVEGDELTPALVRQMVYANVLLMDRYLPGIMAVAFGAIAPAEAIQSIEDPST